MNVSAMVFGGQTPCCRYSKREVDVRGREERRREDEVRKGKERQRARLPPEQE
jgi:hypothetical protein